MEELKRFQGSTFATISRRRLIEDRDTILELTGKIQELQKEINCMNDSRDFQDAESKCSGQSHVTSQPVFGDAHFSFPRKNLLVLCGCFDHKRRVQFEGWVALPLTTITAFLPGSKWSCLFLRIVLQDAMSEDTKFYPLLK